jgi:hypothetical protein
MEIKTALPEEKARGLLLATLTTVMKSLKNNDVRPLKFLLGERLHERADRRALNVMIWQITRELSKSDKKLKAHNLTVKDRIIDGKPKPVTKTLKSKPEPQPTVTVSKVIKSSPQRHVATSKKPPERAHTMIRRPITIPDDRD